CRPKWPRRGDEEAASATCRRPPYGTRAAPARSLSPPRPLASRRSDARSSLLAALVSPERAAPLPLAPSVRPVHSLRGAQTPALPSSLRSSVQSGPRRSRSLPQSAPSTRFAALRRPLFPPRCARQSRAGRAAPARSLSYREADGDGLGGAAVASGVPG